MIFKYINKQIHDAYYVVKPSLHYAFFKDYFKFLKGGYKGQIELYPCLYDKFKSNFDTHYVNHPMWAIEKIKEANPELHVDISSLISFVAFLAPFIKVVHCDFNPPPLKHPNITVMHCDINKLPFGSNSINSLSCMHVVEHIGLGRYGDKIDVCGDKIAMKELSRILKPGGNLYVVVPVGKEKICFNAHRIYAYEQIIKGFKELKLLEFSLVRDGDTFITVNADPELVSMCECGCGCFHFTKD